MKTMNELSIFKTTSIEVLKSLYYKSKSYILNKQQIEVKSNYVIHVTGKITASPIVKKSLNKLENELKIFNIYSIETLKKLYNESIGIV